MERSPNRIAWLAMTLALVAGIAFAGSTAAQATTGCRGHVAYVTPLEYHCEGPCQTHYTGGVQTGCSTEPPW